MTVLDAPAATPATTIDVDAVRAPTPATRLDPERGHRFVFLAMLAEALASYGLATHDLEDAVERCGDRLNVPTRVSATPTSIVLMVGEDEDERTRLILPEPAGLNLARLTELSRIARAVESGETSARAGIEAIHAALKQRPAPSLIADALGSAAIAAVILLIIGAPLPDLAAGAAVGAAVALALHACASTARLSRVAEFTAAVVAAGASSLLHRFAGPIDVFPVTLAGLLPLIPGLALTIAVGEIAAGSLVAGASRLIGSLTVLLSLGFGVAVGFRLVGTEDLALTLHAQTSYPLWATALGLVAVALAMTSAFRARWRDLPVVLASGAIAMTSARWGAEGFGPEFGALAGAFTIGVAALLFERLAGAPAQIALLPGMLLLVPGSVGFRSVHSFLGADALAGAQGVFTMFVIAVGIVTGLLLATVLTLPAPRPPASD